MIWRLKIIADIGRCILCASILVVGCQTCNFQVTIWASHESFASNLEQVSNLLCADANSASYPQQDRKWILAYGYGVTTYCGLLQQWCVCACCTVECGSSCSLAWTMGGCMVHWGIISSCQSAATSEIVKPFCSRVVYELRTFTFIFIYVIMCRVFEMLVLERFPLGWYSCTDWWSSPVTALCEPSSLSVLTVWLSVWLCV